MVPLRGSWQPPGIAVLDRTSSGATGRLAGPAAFMAMRHEARPRPSRANRERPAQEHTTTRIHPHRLAGDRDTATAIGQRVPGVRWAWSGSTTEQHGTLWIYGDDGRSWASITLADQPPYEVEQAGPRRLFEEIREGYRWWKEHDRPTVDDGRIHRDPDGTQRIDLARADGAEQLVGPGST